MRGIVLLAVLAAAMVGTGSAQAFVSAVEESTDVGGVVSHVLDPFLMCDPSEGPIGCPGPWLQCYVFGCGDLPVLPIPAITNLTYGTHAALHDLPEM
jgi:hypothetical protein